jgi:hypothetical protein
MHGSARLTVKPPESFLVSAFPIPALSMHPVPRRSPITFITPVLVAFTVALTEIECVSDPELPVTPTVNVDGVTDGPRLTVNVDEAEPPLGGATELAEMSSDTPLGRVLDTLRATAESSPLIELMVNEEEADPPTLTAIGETREPRSRHSSSS